MTTTVKTRQRVSGSRYSRLENARAYARKLGRKPLTPEQHEEMMRAVADCTNL